MKQQGAVLIVVLWVIVIATLLVGIMASNMRYSADIVLRHKALSQDWGAMMQAVNMAQMELLLERMPKPPTEKEDKQEEKQKMGYRFNGQVLTLHYPQPENIIIRIYDHIGKINLKKLTRSAMYKLLKVRLGIAKDKEINALLDAWQDWIDADDLKRINGAEKDYYETLDPPYQPRNAPLETVEELLDIKGFKEVFGNENLQASFTVYGSKSKINPNFVSREALSLLPGMDKETVEKIIQLRQEKEIKSNADLAFILTPEQVNKARNWFSYSISNYYTIVVYPKPLEGEKAPQYAYIVNVQLKGISKIPTILQVLPYIKRPKSN